MSSVVVLPAPFGPRSATTSPRPTVQIQVADDGDAAVAGVQAADIDQQVVAGVVRLGHVVSSVNSSIAWSMDA